MTRKRRKQKGRQPSWETKNPENTKSKPKKQNPRHIFQKANEEL